MISIRELWKTYGTGPTAISALRGVSLELQEGEFVSIMGPSGCGKSTLLHLLGGLDTVSKGELFLESRPLHSLNETERTELRRSAVGIIFQAFNLLPTLTIEENVLLPALLQGNVSTEIRERAKSLLSEVGIAHRAHHFLHQISGGEMQRAAFARALLLRPRLLLADEPTGNLDSESSRLVLELLQNLWKTHHCTILLVTHSAEIAATAPKQITMRDGQIVKISP